MVHRPLRFLVAMVLLALTVVFVALSFPRSKSPAPVLPNPNGYDDFMRAGRKIVGESVYFATNDLAGLRSCLRTNEEPLRLLKQGLTKECRIPLVLSTNYLPARMSELMMTKRLAHLMAAEGKLAERERRTNDAALVYLEIIRFGNQAVRGGVIIDKLVGLACEATGTISLEKILPGLDAQTCRTAIKVLQQLDERRESTVEVLNQEREWVRRNAAWRRRLVAIIPIPAINPIQRVQQNFIAKVRQQESSERGLMIRLASRAYELEKGRLPSRPQDLAPEYLKLIPTVTAGESNADTFPWQSH